MNKFQLIKQRVYFHITGRCPECGVSSFFIEDHLGYWHCSNCDWSERFGPAAVILEKRKADVEKVFDGIKSKDTKYHPILNLQS